MTKSALCASVLVVSAAANCLAEDFWHHAHARMDDLRFDVYATSRQVERLAHDDEVRSQAWNAMRQMGITKVYLEVYRGGHVVPVADLAFMRDWFLERDVDVVGGIATVPGGDFGMRQEGSLGWFNWQNPKTQRDLTEVMRAAASVFDKFIVDDFLCTGDVSEESKIAKGDRSWGAYRRELLSEMASSVFVGPAKKVNPSITMIVKYPQWYDRFHLFGYDTETLPRIFDQMWVGTETRGRTTQRFGFVQPYQGFVNYRWLAGIAGRKIGGAWFDHGDCDVHDFLDQAYMSVLAGARELVFFNLSDIMRGHSDHQALVAQFDQLADLAAFVRTHPAIGIPAYKPPNSDPAGDMYLIDYLGMLGIPLVPVHQFPENAPVIFLPAQAAADPLLLARAQKAHDRGARLIVTASLLTASSQAAELARLMGLDEAPRSQPFRAQLISTEPSTGQSEKTGVSMDLESPLEIDTGPGDVVCEAEGRQYAFLVTSLNPEKRVVLLNSHTFSQEDFDAVGEVLLCPRELGILEMSGEPLRMLREAFRRDKDLILEGPSCVTLHPLDDHGAGNCVIQNYTENAVRIELTVPNPTDQSRFQDVFTGKFLASRRPTEGISATLELTIPARGRVWIRPEK